MGSLGRGAKGGVECNQPITGLNMDLNMMTSLLVGWGNGNTIVSLWINIGIAQHLIFVLRHLGFRPVFGQALGHTQHAPAQWQPDAF